MVDRFGVNASGIAAGLGIVRRGGWASTQGSLFEKGGHSCLRELNAASGGQEGHGRYREGTKKVRRERGRSWRRDGGRVGGRRARGSIVNELLELLENLRCSVQMGPLRAPQPRVTAQHSTA